MINSFAHPHAFVLRADTRLDMLPANVEGAVDDATLASQLTPLERNVWLVLASAHEANGNIAEAINAVKNWESSIHLLQQIEDRNREA